MASFNFTSFMIGLLLGAIILLLIIWIAYFTRSFLFTYCQSQPSTCGGANYYNNPGDALAQGNNTNDILFLNEQNQLLYKRILKANNCNPESNQTVVMTYPQYCRFSSGTGVSGTWKETAFNSNMYRPESGVGPIVTTIGDCQPAPGSPVDSGVPLVRWDANPISD